MDKKDFTILYVDDEENNLNAFRAAFRRDYQIFTASNGETGLEIVRKNSIHLIITDQRMPQMTGIQFLERVIPEYPDSVRMILTGFSDVEAIIAAINSGQVYHYITKPWNEQELRMTIENARQLTILQHSNKKLVTDLKQEVEMLEKTKRLFMKYVPEPIIEKSLEASGESIFDGELRNIAVLFCDMRGFTPFSEQRSPKEVVKFLNDYYSVMTAVIKRHNGMINQYVGDEIFAAFGAPIAIAECEKSAVLCALEMLEKLQVLNDRYQAMFGGEIKVGIGINYGEVVAGNLGSEEKIEYSLTGDTVNTGKRIEMVTKSMPNTILISDSVYEKVKNLVNTREHEPMSVKGKKGKIMVYEVLGFA